MSKKTEANPLLADVENYPHITVTLPTRGLFYDDDMFEEGTDPNELEAHAFSMWEEVHYNNPFAIMSGKASTKMAKTVAPAILKPAELCSYDIDMLMLAGRLASYGDKMKVTLTCNNPDEKARMTGEGDDVVYAKCDAKNDMEINIQELMNTYPMIDSTDDWRIELPNGQLVLLRPALYRDIIETMKVGVNQNKIMEAMKRFDDISEEKKMELNEASLDNYKTVRIAILISSILGVTTSDGSVTVKAREHITPWLETLKSSWIEIIQDKLTELTEPYIKPGTVTYVCPDCGHSNEGINVVQDPTRFFIQG